MNEGPSDPGIISEDELHRLDDALGQYQSQVQHDGDIEVTLYDFRRAYRLSSAQVERIIRDCDRIGAALNRTLRVYLSGTAGAKFQNIDRMKARQYIGVIPDSAVMTAFTILPDLPAGLMHIDRPLLCAAFDMMLGGSGEDPEVIDGSLTEIELSLLEAFSEEILGAGRAAARVLTVLPEKIDDIYGSPMAVDLLEEDSWVLCASFKMQIGSRRGTMTLGLPSATMQRLLGSANRISDRRKDSESLTQRLNRSSIPVRAVFARSSISAREVASLKVGQVLRLQVPAEKSRTVKVQIAGRKTMCAVAGVRNGVRAVQVV
ncbi:MAG: FliM/FliN family flagellar motor switch protein, partial [Armatimonadota bacterium]